MPPTPVESNRSTGTAAGQAWTQLVLTATGLCLLAVLLPAPWDAVADTIHHRPGSGDQVLEAAVLTAAAMLVWALLGWAAVAAGAAMLSRLPGVVGRQADLVLRVVAPKLVRRLLLTVVGASMVTGLAACGTASPASASVVGSGHPAPSATSAGAIAPLAATNPAGTRAGSWTVVEGSTVHLPPRDSAPGPSVSLVLAIDRADDDHSGRGGASTGALDIDWPSAPAPGPPIDVDWPGAAVSAPSAPVVEPGATPGRPVAADSVVVHRGDSLWSIAAGHLPAGSSDSDIDITWHHWYSANRTVIGPDPDVLLPGQILQPPPPGVPTQRTDRRP